MKTRILPPEEWPRLASTEAETAWKHFDPEQTKVLVVEEDGRIIGTWAVMRVVQVECLWAAPEYRGSFGLAKRLLAGMREIATSWGARTVITGSMSSHVTDLIRRFGGVKSPSETFILPVRIASTRRQDRERGRDFHRQLASQLPEDIHPDDAKHDERVGRALRTAIEEGNPGQAMDEYNAWARGADYAPVRFLGGANGRLRADIVTATVEVGGDYQVHVIKEEESCPLPQ